MDFISHNESPFNFDWSCSDRSDVDRRHIKEAPIKCGETFNSAEELNRIRILPLAERKTEIKIFKEKCLYQTRGISLLASSLSNYFRLSGAYYYDRSSKTLSRDIPLARIEQDLDSYGDRYGLTESQIEKFRTILKECFDSHQSVRRIMQEYPDDVLLFKALFGRSPKGKIEIIELPLALLIRCWDQEDLDYISYGDFVAKTDSEHSECRDEDNIVGGFVLVRDCLILKMKRKIICENAAATQKFDNINGRNNFFSTLRHEEQHVINRIFYREPDIYEHEYSFAYESFLLDLNSSKNDDERLVRIKKFFRYARLIIDALSKDEIIAQSTFGPGDKIKATILEKYDYKNTDFVKKLVSGLLKLYPCYSSLIEEAFQEVFKIEYEQLIAESVEAFRSIYGQEPAALEVLAMQPLHSWKKTADRFLSVNKKID